ncbi:MAG: tandem-95 repeat protein, partial [Burkholderiales bacterium]|nr:tandem-95 repeat protein [Burkholderiales bacterium]
AHGSLLLNTVTGAWTYTPNADYNGPDSFAIAVIDPSGAKTVSTVTVGVTPVNDLPGSADVSRTTAEDNGYTITAGDFAFSDADAGASLQGVRIDTLPTAGTLLLDGVAVAAGAVVSAADIAAGKLVFQPAANANGAPYGSFTFSVQDNAGAFDAAPNTFTLSVTPVNDAPVITDPAANPAGDYAVTTLEDTAAHGSLLLNTVTGAWTYTPNADYNGPDSFAIAVIDPSGAKTVSTVTVGVTPVNDLPTSADVARTTVEDNGYTLSSSDFAFSDADVGASLQGVRIDTLPTAGTLLLNGAAITAGAVVSLADITAGKLVFQPADNASGSPYGSFTFSVQDNAGAFDAAPNSFTLSVTPANDLPGSADVSRSTAEDVGYTVTTADFAFTDVDAGASLQGVRIDTLPAAGSLLLGGVAVTAGAVISAADIAAGKLVFQPAANANGAPYGSFTFSVQDNAGTFDTAPNTFTLNVTPANDAPVTSNRSETTLEDTSVSGQVVATDIDGDTLSYTIKTGVAHGSVALNTTTGAYTYTPAANYNGPDSFTVSVSDGKGGTVDSVVTVNVTPVNDRPSSADVSRTVAEDNGYTLTSADFAFTDVDAGASLQGVRIDTLPGAGTLLLDGVAIAAGTVISAADIAAGKLVFQPADNANGSPYGSFTFSVQDNAGAFDAAPNTFTLSVTPANDAPTVTDPAADAAGNYAVTTAEDTPLDGRVIASDLDGDSLTYAKGSDPAHGTLTVRPDGTWTYTPAADYNGADSFTVTASDGQGGTVASTITVGVTPVNDRPDSADVVRGTAEDTSYTLKPTDFAFSDADSGDSLQAVRIDTLPSAGTLLLDGAAISAGAVVSLADIAAGKLVFQPVANTDGAPYGAFSFSVQDSAGAFDATPNTFTLNVTPVNHAPDSADVVRTTAEDSGYTLKSGDFAFNDTDSGDALQAVRIDTLPTAGTLLLNGSPVAAGAVISAADIAAGHLVFQPAANANGSPYGSFSFSVQDGAGAFDAAPNTFTLDVTPVNDLPSSADVTRTVAEDNGYTLTSADFAFTDVDAGSSLRGVRIDTLPAAGTLLLDGVAVTAGTVVNAADISAGKLVFQPAANASGAPYGSFTFSVQDNAGAFDAAPNSFTLNVTPANDAPVTNNRSETTPEDTSVSGQVVASDIDGDTLSYAIKTGVAHGSVVLNTTT